MLNFNIPWDVIGASQSLVLGGILIYSLVWLLTLGLSLTRVDLDPVTRLMWVMVVIFVPVCGVILYILLAPPRESEHHPIRPRLGSDVSGTPWENSPGHHRSPQD